MDKLEFLSLLESMDSERASMQAIFSQESNEGLIGAQSLRAKNAKNPKYLAKLGEAANLLAGVIKGTKPLYYFTEAMTTSDFPLLFGDILDKQVVANYQETPQVYRAYCKISRVRDFRTVKRFETYGSESVLATVKEQDSYPASSLSEALLGSYSVAKYGRTIPVSWEALVNDDMDIFTDIPARFARAARRTEQKFATMLYADANGPHATLFTDLRKNRMTVAAGSSMANPALSIPALQEAFRMLSAQTDHDSEPIVIEAVKLVVPPALEVTASNILNAVQLAIDPNNAAGTANTVMYTANWMARKTQLVIDPYLPIVSSVANGNTSWYLFADPNNGRPALEMGFLVGHEQPQIFMKTPNTQRVGGGAADVFLGDFDTDSVQYKIRAVMGGTRLDYKMVMASNGSGA